MPAVVDGLDGGDALPGRCGGQTFTQYLLWRQPRPGPVAPDGQLRPVNPGQALHTVNQQFLLAAPAHFVASLCRCLRAALAAGEWVRLADAAQNDGAKFSGFTTQVDRSGAIAHDHPAIE